MKNDFSGRKALVVGGSGGIGAAVAVELGRRGAEVVVHGGHSEERLSRTVSAVRQAGGSARGFILPIDPAAVPVMAPLLLEALPKPDILICAWGAFMRRPLETTSPADWVHMAGANLILPGVLVSSVLGAMMEQRWGRILLFGGTNTDTLRGYRSTAAYSSAKAALGVLAKSVALSAGPMGVVCNVVCPGLVDTEYLDDDARKYAEKLAPRGKLLSVQELARVALELVLNPSVNGAVVPVDAGLRI